MRRLVCLLAGLSACAGSDPPPREPGPSPCVGDDDCDAGENCHGGFCEPDSGGDDDAPPAPEIVLLTESARWIDVPRGRDEARQVRFKNFGPVNLVVSRASVQGSAARIEVTPAPSPGDFTMNVPPEAEAVFTLTFTADDGVPFTAILEVESDDLLSPIVRVPLIVEYTGQPTLVLTPEPGGQHAESLDGTVLDLGAVPTGLGRTRRLYLKNLGSGGAFARFTAPAPAGQGLAVTLGGSLDPDGTFRLPRFHDFCDADNDCGQGSTCNGGACADDTWRDVLTVDIDASASPGQALEGELVLVYAPAQGGLAKDVRLSLRGHGVAQDVLVLEPESLDFGDVSLGFPAARLLHLVNATGETLELATMQLSGAGADGIAPPIRATVLGVELPVSLLPLDEQLVRVDFVATPGRLGAAAAQLYFTVTGRVDPYIVLVEGRARLGPRLATEPLAELDAGEVHVGTAADGVVTLRNTAVPGADALLFHDVSLEPGGVLLERSPAGPLLPVPAGGETSVTLHCTPLGLGPASGLVRFSTDAPDNPVQGLVVRCSGKDPALAATYGSRDVAAALSIEAEHACRGEGTSPCMDLGALYLGGEAALVLTIGNTGVGPLVLGEAVVEPAGVFTVQDPTGAVVPPGETLELEVTYAGSGGEAFDEAVLTLSHDDADVPPLVLRLVGSTTACPAELRDCSASAACAESQTAAACCRAFDDGDACGPTCTPCPSYSHALAGCEADSCAYECREGHVDLDGDGSGAGQNGCEYACTTSGEEVCDGADGDCDGFADDSLDLGDDGGEAPAACVPGSSTGLLGFFDDADLGEVVIGGGAAPNELVTVTARAYVTPGDPAGDTDWWRLVLAEDDACDAVGFRLDAVLQAPVSLELCGALAIPSGPLFDTACAAVSDCVSVPAGEARTLRFEWSERCGDADDRVLDLRVSGGTSCEPYALSVFGATLR